MSETAGDIIKDALTELTIQAQEQSVPAVDLNTGIRYLNRMMSALDADGIKLGYTIVSAPNDNLTIPAGAYESLVYMLAMRLAPGFDIQVSPDLRYLARDGEKRLAKIGVTMLKQNFPSTLPIGSGNTGTDNIYHDQTFFPGCCEDQDECEDS